MLAFDMALKLHHSGRVYMYWSKRHSYEAEQFEHSIEAGSSSALPVGQLVMASKCNIEGNWLYAVEVYSET